MGAPASCSLPFGKQLEKIGDAPHRGASLFLLCLWHYTSLGGAGGISQAW